jgi:hypothetical protein
MLKSHHTAFNCLVGIGSLTTAGCWLVMPWLLRGLGTKTVQTVERAPSAD